MGIVDFHSHLIPGVDDGAETLEQSLVAIQTMWEQGITHIITTPHFRAHTLNDPTEFETRIALVDEAWETLRAAAKEEFPDLWLDRGCELALDEPLAAMPDERVRLAGTRFMLVEFPRFLIPAEGGKVLAQLVELGVTPIVAHPERYDNLDDDDLDVLVEWKKRGAFLQVDVGSVVGDFGDSIEASGWKILELGLGDYLSSDYHAWRKCFVADAQNAIVARGGEGQFKTLSVLNGERLLRGEDPVPVGGLS
ncbi:MAG: tyrosine-protein phosphatase [Gemmatimonadaceae bacterium]